mgnify:CR=1 FL=1
MARSLKKGPFVDESVMKKIKALNEANKKEELLDRKIKQFHNEILKVKEEKQKKIDFV